jgi:hypothetical protein
MPNRLLALHEVPMIGINAFEKIVSLPIFTSPFTEIISTNFQDLVFRIGSGDEKLSRFTGSSGDSRLVPNKPGRIGLWFYQLCASLRYGNAYLFWCKLHHSNPFLGETVPVSSIVESWAKVVKKLPRYKWSDSINNGFLLLRCSWQTIFPTRRRQRFPNVGQ